MKNFLSANAPTVDELIKEAHLTAELLGTKRYERWSTLLIQLAAQREREKLLEAVLASVEVWQEDNPEFMPAGLHKAIRAINTFDEQQAKGKKT